MKVVRLRIKQGQSIVWSSQKTKKKPFQFKHFYHYIGNCPFCGSPHTGRILSGYSHNPVKESYLIRYLARRKGEYAKYTSGEYHTAHNVYCDECGAEWKGDIKILFLSKEEWENITGNISEKMMGASKYFKIKRKTHRKNKRKERWRKAKTLINQLMSK